MATKRRRLRRGRIRPGKEYYAADGTAPRSRFLDVGKPSDTPSYPAGSGSSILGLDSTPPIIPPEELAKTSRRRWLWGSILAVVAIFGGLGYLEGRAQSTHEFRGPVEIAREGYGDARQWLRTKVEPADRCATAPCTGNATKPAEPKSKARLCRPHTSPTLADRRLRNRAHTAGANSQPKDTPPQGKRSPRIQQPAGSRRRRAPPKPLEVPLDQAVDEAAARSAGTGQSDAGQRRGGSCGVAVEGHLAGQSGCAGSTGRHVHQGQWSTEELRAGAGAAALRGHQGKCSRAQPAGGAVCQRNLRGTRPR